jgi:succinate dehydrogenase / fumarate reductase membrane anchor subunit
MDYIKPTGVRLTLHVVVIVLLVGYTGWVAQTLWRL